MATDGLQAASPKIKKEKKVKKGDAPVTPGGAPSSGVVIVDGVATGGNKASRKAALKRHSKKQMKAVRVEANGGPPAPVVVAAAAPAAGAAPAADSTSEVTKKEKKRKQPVAEIEPPTEALVDAAPAVAADTAKAEKKKAKKAAAAAAAAAAATPSATAEPSANGAASPPSQKKAKKSKTAAPATAPEAAPETVSATPAADAAAPPPEKKAKKAGKVVVMPAGPRMSAVGSKDMAAIGKEIVRDLYVEHPTVTAMSDAEVATIRAARATVVEGSTLKPVLQFDQSGFPDDLLFATRGFATPSPIQMECWPVACAGRDAIGIAATGSGKTLAFGLPALLHIQAQIKAGVSVGKAPSVLMLSPTRELAMQIAAVMEEAGSRAGLTTICTYGGVPKHTQASALRKGVHIIVATPGRLKDLMQDGAARLGGVTYLVLDEADRMLDLGFEPDIRAIASETRADRQTLMFSATWPMSIQKLASEFLYEPVKVTIGSQDLSASHSVKQTVEIIAPRDRDRRLEQLLKQYHSSRKNRVIVFVLYKKEAARVEQQLVRAGWKAAAVHGDASQQQRTRAVEQFKSGEVPLLIATDVAARGLDIPDVEFVINYSFPLTTEDYVHRIGRTGRAGKTGTAHTFFSGESDKARAGELINVLKEANQDVPAGLLAFGTTVKKKESKLYGAHFKEVDMTKKATKMTFDDSDDE